MKGFQKLTLAAAIAAAPFAQAEMMSIDDAMLGEMTGQAGITIDADVQVTIDAIKYVDSDGVGSTTLVSAATGQFDNTGTAAVDGGFDSDGNAEAVTQDVFGTQGAITMSELRIGSIAADGTLSAAQIRGVTIDADGSRGVVIGLGQIGDAQGNGIDIEVGAVLINNGNANLTGFNAVNAAVYAGGADASTLNYADYADGTATATVVATFNGANVGTYASTMTDAAAVAVGYADQATLFADLTGGDAALAGAASAATVAAAGGELALLGGGSSAGALALAVEANDLSALSAVGTAIASAGNGNIGGVKIENFTNYLKDELVTKYNGVFDMALEDSTGTATSTVIAGDTGRYVQGEIVINGTGTKTGDALTTTGGLQISGLFGGGITKAAWVDTNGGEFGVTDLGFFNGVDTDGDSLSDTIEGMKFSLNIDVETINSSVAGTNSVDGSAFVAGTAVSALHISNMSLEGTIMIGSIYLGNEAGTMATSLGSVLIKDIDMAGTEVWIYGH